MYKKGNIVISRDGSVFKILKHIPNRDSYETLQVSNGKFKLLHRRDILGHYDKVGKCPVCSEEWTISFSPILNSKWEDCSKCGKTREQIEKEQEEKIPDHSHLNKPDMPSGGLFGSDVRWNLSNMGKNSSITPAKSYRPRSIRQRKPGLLNRGNSSKKS